MPTPDAIALAVDAMRAFAVRTGLVPGTAPPRRYLWTDAFALCNFIALSPHDAAFDGLAAALVDQVHHVLGRHRADDPRSGWISGLAEAEGEAHPTRGGLRIGKPLPERTPSQPVDPELEWERDGQYFHYLTRWMHALDQYAGAAARPRANLWARELAQAAHAAFTRDHAGGTRPRMVWKMSIDLSRALVASMGQHDPLDGLITYRQIRAHRTPGAGGPDLAREIRDMSRIASGCDWRSDDPLGIGGLLVDAWRLAQLPPVAEARMSTPAGPTPAGLLDAALAGLAAWSRQRPLQRPAEQRLGFRELGLAIGLRVLPRLQARAAGDPGLLAGVKALLPLLPLADAIEDFWLQPAHRESDAWIAHHDINEAMLATALVPAGYLDLR